MSPNRGSGKEQSGVRGPGALPKLNSQAIIRQVFGDRMIPTVPGNCANPGLVFERYLRIWQEGEMELLQKGRFRALDQFVKEYKECGRVIGPNLQETHRRLDQAGDKLAVERRTFKTQERLVSGLGASHPLENGFAFESTLGVPYLPGSSIKGLAKIYSYYELDAPTRERLFGQENERGESEASGDVIFFPAYPERWPELEVDVINCHHPGYYNKPSVKPATAQVPDQKGNRSLLNEFFGPIEYESPVPVFFLTVAKGTSFVFRCGSRLQDGANAQQALALLERGLKEFGIGAKTALGYGVME